MRRGLAVVAGLLLALALPRPSVAGLAWVAPGVMLFAARGGKPFRLGYLAGLTHYLVSLSWLLHIPVTFYPILGWIALAGYLALCPALWLWLCAHLLAQPSSTWFSRLGRSLLCAAAWVGIEMIVSRLFSGFPWNLLGSSQYRMLPLIQVAAWTGVYGLSFLIVWFSVSLFHTGVAVLTTPAARHVLLREVALPMFAVAILYACGLHSISRSNAEQPAKSLRIALVQPSIPQTMIWNPAEASTRFAELLRLSSDALAQKPDLLIWPEAAVPKMVRDDPGIQLAITDLARTNKAWIIIGSDDFEVRGTNDVYFNSSFLVSPNGELVSTYRKRRLVIFGEYVPLIDWLPFIKYFTPITGGFVAGEKPVTFDLGSLGVRTSVLICFEDTFAHYAREHATADVDFLVNITNDGWFGDSAAQWQHAANAVFRSVENDLPLVRCSNNGITCWIDSAGAMHDVGFDNYQDVYRAGMKIITLPLKPASARSATFYNRYGDIFGWVCVAFTAALVITRIPRRSRK